MFQDIRKKGSSLIITLMFAAIIVTFVISFGPGDKAGCSSVQNNAGTVNGEVISMSEFRFAYSNLYDYYQRVFRDFNNEMAKQYKLSEKALNGLIGEILVAQEAEKLGFKVSDEEVGKEIMSSPYFQKNGAFDKESYNNMVKFTLNTTMSDYERRVKMQLLSKKLRNYLLENITVSDTEAKDEFVAANEKIEAKVYVFSDSNLKSDIKNQILASISDDDAAAFLKDNESKVKLTFDDNVSKYSKGEGTTTFEDVKISVAKDLLAAPKIDEKIKADSAKLLEMLKEKSELTAEEISAAFADWELSDKDISVTKKSTFAAGIGFSPKFIEKLFSSPVEGWLKEVFVTEEDRYVVANIVKHAAADMAEFEKSKENIKAGLVNSKKSQIYESYVEKLRAGATISLNKEFLRLFENSEN